MSILLTGHVLLGMDDPVHSQPGPQKDLYDALVARSLRPGSVAFRGSQEREDVEKVQSALESGADPNLVIPICCGNKVLRYAAPLAYNTETHPEIIRLLVAHGARLNTPVNCNNDDRFVQKSLMQFIIGEFIRPEKLIMPYQARRMCTIIETLKELGIEITDDLAPLLQSAPHSIHFCTAGVVFHMLCADKNPLSCLIDSINKCDEDAVIHFATQELVNQRDEFGFSPMSYALLGACYQNKKIIGHLIEKGAHKFDPIGLTGNKPAQATRFDIRNVFESKCPVCWDALGEANTKARRCGHIFCTDCFNHLNNEACPLCRH